MLERVEIENFRGLRQVSVPLKPLTVLVGANNSGKSSFLDGIRLLGGITTGNQAQKVFDTDVWHLDRKLAPRIVGACSGGGTVEAKRDGQYWRPTGSEQVNPINFFNESILLPSMTSMGVGEKDRIPHIDNKVSNLPAYLDALLRRDRDRFFSVLDTLKKLIPGLTNINISTPTAESRRIDIEWENGLVIEAQYASYGVRLMIFFVCLANHPTPAKTILIEEPETGVHPKRLADIVALLVSLSEGKLAPTAAQVIITTHSPYLLDCINPEHHQVLVCQRNSSGETHIQPVDTDQLKFFLDDFSLGEIWLNRAEKGLVKED